MIRSKVFKIAAAAILVITAFFWLIKALMDMVGGVQGGSINLLLAIVMLGLTWLSWKFMLLGGIVTSFLAVIMAVYFNLVLPNIYVAYIPLVLMCAPMVLSGLFFIEADWAKKKRD